MTFLKKQRKIKFTGDHVIKVMVTSCKTLYAKNPCEAYANNINVIIYSTDSHPSNTWHFRMMSFYRKISLSLPMTFVICIGVKVNLNLNLAISYDHFRIFDQTKLIFFSLSWIDQKERLIICVDDTKREGQLPTLTSTRVRKCVDTRLHTVYVCVYT